MVLGDVEDLMRNGMYVGQLNMQKYVEIKDYTEFITQVRYNSSGTLSKIVQQGDQMEVEFFSNVKGIAPGQSAVFYEGDDVVGGGIINRSL